MSDQSSTPKLHIDSDWKAQAQREKEKLAEKEQARAAAAATAKPGAAKPGPGTGGTAGTPAGTSSSSAIGTAAGSAAAPGEGHPEGHPEGELPEASFRTLMSMLASQAIMGLGAMADQQSGRVVIDLEGARFAIDLLDILEQKTKGNLDAAEDKELRQLLAELRGRYVQIAQLVARQMAAQQPGIVTPGDAALGAGGMGPGGMGAGGIGGVIPGAPGPARR